MIARFLDLEDAGLVGTGLRAYFLIMLVATHSDRRVR